LLEPEWSERALEPLQVQLEDVARRADGAHVEERRRYRAFAFREGGLELDPIVISALPKAGGGARSASSVPLALVVESALAADDAGVPELPGEPLVPPVARPLWPWALGALVAALLGQLVRVALRRAAARRAELPPPAPSGPAAHERALERLARLRARSPASALELDAYYVEAAGAVRDYLGERFELRAPRRTTEELVAAPETARALAEEQRELVGALLGECDLVKFARHAPTAAERERLSESAVRLVRETSPR